MDNSAIVSSGGVPVGQLSLGGVLQIPAVRQVTTLVGIAAAVTIGFAVFLWSQTPGYTQLYGNLEPTDAAQVIDALKSAEIDYKLGDNGGIMVPQSRLHDARLQIAGQGLSQGSGGAMDLLQDQSSFGVSQFMESARYQHALETELARTITSLGAVREARVHLALPKQSAFLREQNSASASVLLQLGRGSLEPDQAAAIVNLVASSVPNLKSSNVTLIDQFGRLLSTAGDAWGEGRTMAQFKHAERLEEIYTRRIEELLTPLVGPGRVRAQVSASLDFTVTEETRESYDPTSTAVRSEQVSEDQRLSGGVVGEGVPGALSNQPPETPLANGVANAADATETVNASRSSVRNFELDRTVSHVRPQTGTIQRLSVAVLVDDSPPAGDTNETAGAEASAQPAFNEQDIARFTTLVKEAVGFDEARGDTVVVVNAAFREAEIAGDIDEPAFWESPLLRDTLKQLLGVALVLALAFGLVRPMLRSLLADTATAGAEYATGGATGELLPSGAAPSFDDKVTAARNIAGHDPARVAQLVKKWVAAND